MPKLTVTKNMGSALKNLRQFRKVKAITLAKAIGKTGAYISKLEKGELNTIDRNDFVKMIQIMSRNENEYTEAITTLFKDTTMEYTEEEKENIEWKLTLDFSYRLLPIKEEYTELVKSKMEELRISSVELSNYINANANLYNDPNFTKDQLDNTPKNKWIFNNDDPFILMEISPKDIDDILLIKNESTCYINLFCILVSLYELNDLDRDNACKQAKDDLRGMKIYTISETEDIMQSFKKEKEINDLLSQKDNENLPLESKKLLSSLYEFTNNIYGLSFIDSSYISEKIIAMNESLKNDKVVTLKLIGTDITPLKDKPHQVKKEFFEALDDLIQEYSKKEINEEPELL